MELVRTSSDQGGAIGVYTRNIGVVLSCHDNCGDRETRLRWIKAFGLVRPIWILKRSRKTIEFGLEIAGTWFTIFVE